MSWLLCTSSMTDFPQMLLNCHKLHGIWRIQNICAWSQCNVIAKWIPRYLFSLWPRQGRGSDRNPELPSMGVLSFLLSLSQVTQWLVCPAINFAISYIQSNSESSGVLRAESVISIALIACQQIKHSQQWNHCISWRHTQQKITVSNNLVSYYTFAIYSVWP